MVAGNGRSRLFKRVELQINRDKLLRMNKGGSPMDAVSETLLVQMWRMHLSTAGVFNLGDVIRSETNETCDWIENSSIILTFAKRAWVG